jgi:nucleoside-diphosphate-sugar epimerase
MNARSSGPGLYRRANTEGTLTLGDQAAKAGVRRFIFLSSLKVLGEETAPDSVFRADDRPNPVDPYAISKLEAEDGLKAIAARTDMELVIIRPPLVYGPGVKGNFATMIRWVAKGVPLPLGGLRQNQRSLVALDNLVDLIITAIDHPAAGNETFLAGDGEDLSTTELLERIAHAFGRPPRLLPIPAWMLQASARLLGQQSQAARLIGSLQIDIAKTRELLQWSPPVSVEEGLRRTADAFRESERC